MEKVKLILDIEEFKSLYNEKFESDYDNAKEQYQKSRKRYIESLVFLLSGFLFLGINAKLSEIYTTVTSCVPLYMIMFICSLFFLSYELYKSSQKEKDSLFCNIKLRQKNYEKVVPKEKYYEYWIYSETKNENDYIVLIYNILTDRKYKLLNISFTYRKSEHDYLMKIYYSIDDRVKIYNKTLWNEIRTDIEDFTITLYSKQDVIISPRLYIPYVKSDVVESDVEYYADITKLLGSK